MKLRQIITICVDIVAGSIVVTVGLMMLPFPLNILWGIFNAYMWIAVPIILYKANRTEEKK